MINKDLVLDLIMKLDVFMTKKGQDITSRKDLIKAINSLTGEDSLDTIYVNNIDNFNIPDVVVLPLYNEAFNVFLMNTEAADICPFGYTVEIHQRCFDAYTAEELAAVIIHDILQNVQSTSAKTRWLKAYNDAMSKYDTDTILSAFDNISNSEIAFMGYMDICTRPFRVPVMQYDYIGTDEVLKSIGLGDAYDSYLEKYFDSMKHWVNVDQSNNNPEVRIETEVKNDFRTMKTILASCMDKDIRHYYNMIRTGVPLVSLDHIFSTKEKVASLGFISRKKAFKRRNAPEFNEKAIVTISESFINPKNEIELRYQIDKIITDMRYAETESERQCILIKIKNLTIKLAKNKADLEKRYIKYPQDQSLRARMEYTQNAIDELEMLRDKTVTMEIRQKRYGLYVNYPVGYEDSGPVGSDKVGFRYN